MIWEFDVGVSTHDWLAKGVLVVEYRRVIVVAPTYNSSALIACQLAACDGTMPTELLLRV